MLLKRKFVAFPLTREAQKKVDAIVANISHTHFGADFYPTNELKAVAYLYFLIKDHPFIDGNKRTATLTFEILCDLNDLDPDYSQFSLDLVAVYLEKTQERDHKKVIFAISRILFPEHPAIPTI